MRFNSLFKLLSEDKSYRGELSLLPEQQLIAAVVLRAINDCFPPRGMSGHTEANIQEARDWIFSDEDRVMSFIWCLENIYPTEMSVSLAAKKIRAKIKLLEDEQFHDRTQSQPRISAVKRLLRRKVKIS